MLAEIFIVNRKGHLIFRETGVHCNGLSSQHYHQYHNVIRTTPDTAPYFCDGGVHFYHLLSDGIRWVAAAGSALPSLQVLCWLQALRDVVHNICGGATESALRANHLALRQLATEIMEDGSMLALDASRLRALLLTRPCVAATAQLGSPDSLALPSVASDGQHNVYVDVVESVECVVTSEGEVQRCEVAGRLEVRTDGAGCSRVDVSLAEDVKLLEADEPEEAHLGPQVRISRLHPSACRQARWLSGPAGRLTLLEYTHTCAAGSSAPALPVSVRAAAVRLPSSPDLELRLRLRLLAAPEQRAPSISLQFRPPAGCGTVSATCDGPGGGVVKHCHQTALVTWTVRELSGQQEATAVLRLAEAGVSGGPDLCVGPFQLSWEISDLTVSGLRVAGVRLAGVPDGRTRRWVRHAAVSAGTHTVQPAAVADHHS